MTLSSSSPVPIPKKGPVGGIDTTVYQVPGTWTCGGILRVSDPGHPKAAGTGGTRPALAGPWRAAVHDDGHITRLITWAAAAADATHADPRAAGWSRAPFGAQNSTGQCGVFDDAQYPAGHTGEYGEKSTFYSKACLATSPPRCFGRVEELGVVCVAGEYCVGSNSAVYERAGPTGLVDAVCVDFEEGTETPAGVGSPSSKLDAKESRC